MEVRIDDAARAVLALDHGLDRLAPGAVTGGVKAAASALRVGTREALGEVARPWAVDALLEAAPRIPTGSFDEVVVTQVDAEGDPHTVTARLGDSGWHLVLRPVLPREVGAWRLAAAHGPDDPPPVVRPEIWFTMPFPARLVGPGNDLRWLCLALEEVCELLGSPIVTMPGRGPMTDETEDLGQGETRRVRRVAWDVGRAFVEAEAAEHEIFDGATPRWGSLMARASGLDDDMVVRLNVGLSVGSTPRTTVLLSARRHVLDAAVARLTDRDDPLGNRALAE